MTTGIEDFIQDVCVQTAVYWGNPTPDGYGKMVYDDPIEISCRWTDTTRVINSANGDQIVCRAEVMVTQDLDYQGMLYLGSLDDLDSDEAVNPTLIPTAYEIKRFDKVPMIFETNEFVRKVYL
jgi:hypothetical protein